MKELGKITGDTVHYTLEVDPDPLGVAVPEVLEAMLAQDDDARKVYEMLTDGKKRSLIYSISKIKDIDRQVAASIAFLQEQQKLLKKQSPK